MTNPPLTRHPALQPFSRDHYTGLVQAQHLLRAADDDANARCRALAEFVDAWNIEIAEHFADEESLLLPLMTEAQKHRLKEEHDALRSRAGQVSRLGTEEDPGRELARELGQLLNDHIRWEERKLFPAIEQTCSHQQLADLQRRTTKIESRRPRAVRRTPSRNRNEHGKTNR